MLYDNILPIHEIHASNACKNERTNRQKQKETCARNSSAD